MDKDFEAFTTWCKFGAKTYRTMRKICNDMR